MFLKLVAVFALLAIANASDLSSFSYGVADPYTGDFKHQFETRAGNNVRGQYGLLESDGTQRTVDYAAGAGGFNAIVRKDPALIAAAPLSYAAAPWGYPGYARFAGLGLAAPYAYRGLF